MSDLREAKRALEVLARRRHDGLRMFRSIDKRLDPNYADQSGLYADEASEILINGGNRGGKSLAAATLFAAIARDEPITTWDGRKIDCRRPWQKGRELQMWVIGLQVSHFTTIHRLLFRAGTFKIIRDKESGQWRAWMPWNKADALRAHETKPAPPLIPHSLVDPKSWTWESKSSRQFTHVHIPGKADIWCFPSTAQEPRQGEPVDVIWIDEAIENPAHYTEWQMRLSDERGRIFWSSYARKGNPALIDLHERAEQQAQEVADGIREKADVSEYLFVYEHNPFIPRDEVRKRREGMSEEEWQARNFGRFNLNESRIYPFFDKYTHAAIPVDDQLDDEIARVLRRLGGIPPADWTHELILDPGAAKPAVLFAAVPPRDLWGGREPVLVAYRELYGRMTAAEMARKVRELTAPGTVYRRWIIDNQMGRQTQVTGRTVSSEYSDAFAKENLSCEETGTAFSPGVPSFEYCRQKMNLVLAVGGDGRPRFRVVTEHCPNLVWQLTHNSLQIVGDMVTDKENIRERNDVRKCAEMWLSRDPMYVEPPSVLRGNNPYEEFKKSMRRLFGNEERRSVHVGPGEAA